MSRKLLLLMFLALMIGTLNLASRVEKAEASGTIYIRPDGSIDPPLAPIQCNGSIYTLTNDVTSSEIRIMRNNIVLDGAGYIVTGWDINDGFCFGVSVVAKNVTVRNVHATNCYRGIHVAGSNGTVYGCNATNNNIGISTEQSYQYINIIANMISDNDMGISIGYYSDYNIISGNNMSSNTRNGIWLGYGVKHNLVSSNNITNNEKGVGLYVSSYNTISNNQILANTDSGIYLDTSPNNTISGNQILNNAHSGIDMWKSSNNTVAQNIILNHYQDGIRIDKSLDNIFIWNNITNNLRGAYLILSSGNIFNYNNFIDNTNNAPYFGADYSNSWSCNYWYDYTGFDVNDDGIGDTSYVINDYNKDNSPLIKAIPEFPSLLVLPLFMLVTLLAIIVNRRKHTA